MDLTDLDDKALLWVGFSQPKLTCNSIGSLLLPPPSSIPDNEIELDASFSQKVPVGILPYRATFESMLCSLSQTKDRNSTYRTIQRALCKVFVHSAGCNDRWHNIHPEPSDEEIRYGIGSVYRVADVGPSCFSTVAKELEFSVHSMSPSQAGYTERSTSAVNSIMHLIREEGWPQEEGVSMKQRTMTSEML